MLLYFTSHFASQIKLNKFLLLRPQPPSARQLQHTSHLPAIKEGYLSASDWFIASPEVRNRRRNYSNYLVVIAKPRFVRRSLGCWIRCATLPRFGFGVDDWPYSSLISKRKNLEKSID